MSRIYHKAAKFRSDGATSALCFKSPRAINVRAATWTNRNEAVTCKKCLAILNNSPASAGGEHDNP